MGLDEYREFYLIVPQANAKFSGEPLMSLRTVRRGALVATLVILIGSASAQV